MDAFLDTSKINNSRNKLSTLLPLWALCASASLLLGWLSHFLAPQPLPLTAPLLGALASVIHHTLTFPSAPLVQLVVSFPLPSASLPPPSCHDSAWCCLLLHPSCLVSLSHCPASQPIVQMLVMLPLNTTASCASLPLIHDSPQCPQPQKPYLSRTMPSSPGSGLKVFKFSSWHQK